MGSALGLARGWPNTVTITLSLYIGIYGSISSVSLHYDQTLCYDIMLTLCTLLEEGFKVPVIIKDYSDHLLTGGPTEPNPTMFLIWF